MFASFSLTLGAITTLLDFCSRLFSSLQVYIKKVHKRGDALGGLLSRPRTSDLVALMKCHSYSYGLRSGPHPEPSISPLYAYNFDTAKVQSFEPQTELGMITKGCYSPAPLICRQTLSVP